MSWPSIPALGHPPKLRKHTVPYQCQPSPPWTQTSALSSKYTLTMQSIQKAKFMNCMTIKSHIRRFRFWKKWMWKQSYLSIYSNSLLLTFRLWETIPAGITAHSIFLWWSYLSAEKVGKGKQIAYSQRSQRSPSALHLPHGPFFNSILVFIQCISSGTACAQLKVILISRNLDYF